MTNPIDLYQKIANMSPVERACVRLNAKLEINENNVIPIVPQTNQTNDVTIEDLADAQNDETVKNSQVQAANTVTPQEQAQTVSNEANQAQATETTPINTEPTKVQLSKIKVLKNTYTIPEENITMLDDGSVKVVIKSSSSDAPEIIFDNTGKIVSAKNVTGIMMKNYLFKDDKDIFIAAYEIAPGEGSEKTDNFNKGTYNIATDKDGNMVISFEKKYVKPVEDGGSSSSYSSTEYVTLVNGKPVETSETSEQSEDDITINSNSNQYVTITPNGEISIIEIQQVEEQSQAAASETLEESDKAVENQKDEPEKADVSEKETSENQSVLSETNQEPLEIKSPEKDTSETPETQTSSIEPEVEVPATNEEKDIQTTDLESVSLNQLPQQNIDFLKESGFIGDDGWKLTQNVDDSSQFYIEFGDTMIFVNCKMDGKNITEIVSWGGKGGIEQMALASCYNFSKLSGIPLQELLTAKDKNGNNLYEIKYHIGTDKITIKKNGANPYALVYNYADSSLQKGVNLPNDVTNGVLQEFLTKEQIKNIEAEVKASLDKLGLDYSDGAYSIEQETHWLSADELIVTFNITDSNKKSYKYTYKFKKQDNSYIKK